MTPDTTYSGPYARAAQLYRDAGWHSPIPIGVAAGVKSPPPTGYTGWAGVTPSGADVYAWIETHGDRNVGLHLPPGVYVLDIDQYKDKTGGDNIAALGVLPATWTSTARAGIPSRHHFFRASPPAGRMWKDHPVPHTESLHTGHRYAVVWPSTNPDADGALYRWYRPDGTAADDGQIPRPEDLAELPASWIETFTQPGEPLDGTASGDAETREILGAWPSDPDRSKWCEIVRRWVDEEAARLDRARSGGDIREPGRVLALIGLGRSGHLGVPHALAWHEQAYVALRAELRGESEQFAGAEWWRQVKGVGKTGDQHSICRCADRALPPLIPIEAPPDFSMPAVTSSLQAAGIAPDLDMIRADTAELSSAQLAVRLAELTEQFAHTLTRKVREQWRQGFKDLGMPYAQFDRIVKASAAERAAIRAETARAALAEKGGRQMSPPANPMAVARELLKDIPATDGVPHLGHWRGDFYTHTGTHWVIQDDGDVRSWIYRETEHSWFMAGTDDEPTTEKWLPNQRKVASVADALGTGVLHRRAASEHEPCIALTNGVYDLPSEQLLEHSPTRWNLTALPFAYEPGAACPRWLAFLQQVLPQDSVTFLQEWMGYLISGRTNQQKIASLVGLPRTGKGTVARIIRALLGSDAVAGPTLGSLIGPFGLEPLLGKSLALFADVKWTARGVADATELIKTISGEDGVTVHRKNRGSWEGDLPARFMFMSNDTPAFTDASGALSNRLIHIRFTRSFLGRENINLTPELMTELPGIFLWALEGLRRLDERGRFHVPAASAEVDLDVRRTASPHLVFVEERCVLDAKARTTLDSLWNAWALWCAEDGAEEGNQRWFTRKLKSVVPDLDAFQEHTTIGKRRWLIGIRLADSPFPIEVPQL